jgi:hypothetical protein
VAANRRQLRDLHARAYSGRPLVASASPVGTSDPRENRTLEARWQADQIRRRSHEVTRGMRGRSATAARGRVALDRFEVRVEDHDEPTVVRAQSRLDQRVVRLMVRRPRAGGNFKGPRRATDRAYRRTRHRQDTGELKHPAGSLDDVERCASGWVSVDRAAARTGAWGRQWHPVPWHAAHTARRRADKRALERNTASRVRFVFIIVLRSDWDRLPRPDWSR